MAKLPKIIKLTRHAKQRLLERNTDNNIYNVKNVMRSSCKWYGKDDLIPDSALYLHCLYVCRKSKQIGYITDGNIEIIYNKGTGVAITVMEVKDKFLPITQYIKPDYLEKIKNKKKEKKMEDQTKKICPDCGKERDELTVQGICAKCKTRKNNAIHRRKVYIPYINLSEEEKLKIDHMQSASTKAYEEKRKKLNSNNNTEEIPLLDIPTIENYYEVKATQNPAIAHTTKKPNIINQTNIVDMLSEYDAIIPNETLKEILNVFSSLKESKNIKQILINIFKNKSTIINLENIIDDIEKKLQYKWESNLFQGDADTKFKNFLIWRNSIKESIDFLKDIYQIEDTTNNDIKQSQLNNNSDSNDNSNSDVKKKFQITTETISTIYNTKRPFTRIFYATSKDEAYKDFVTWITERQLHENKDKTIITELV